ncbi:MAG: hypothetical protein PF689_00795 [Deltaproteobacteria bacterium]|nr:hypothetical protein [Deltaproteobacteria bacterium]
MKYFVIFLSLFFGFSACTISKTTVDSTTDPKLPDADSKSDSKEQKTKSSLKVSEKAKPLGTITGESIGIVKIGDPLDKVPGSIQRKEKVYQAEGDKYKKYLYYQDSKLLFEVIPRTDNNTIGEIRIHSSRFQTKQGLSTASTLQQVIASCENKYTLFYTYVSQSYIISCKQTPKIQFLINPAHFIGEKISPKSDQEFLKPSLFQKDAEIIKIRIY